MGADRRLNYVLVRKIAYFIVFLVIFVFVAYVPIGLMMERGAEGLRQIWTGEVFSNYHLTFWQSLFDVHYFFGEIFFSCILSVSVAAILLQYNISNDTLVNEYSEKTLKSRAMAGAILALSISVVFFLGGILDWFYLPPEDNHDIIRIMFQNGDPEHFSRQLPVFLLFLAGWAYLPYLWSTVGQPVEIVTGPTREARRKLPRLFTGIALVSINLLLVTQPLKLTQFFSQQLLRDILFLFLWQILLMELVAAWDLGVLKARKTSEKGAPLPFANGAGKGKDARHARLRLTIIITAIAFTILGIFIVVLVNNDPGGDIGVYRLLQRVFVNIFQGGLFLALYYGGLYSWKTRQPVGANKE